MIVDIHSHVYPDWFLDFFRERSEPPCVIKEAGGDRLLLFTTEDGASSGPLMTDSYTKIAAKLEFMDQHGIDCSVVSLGNPWLEVFNRDSVALAREANARLAKLRRETSGRIVGMGVLPTTDPHDVAMVVEEAASEPGLSGVISSTTISGMFLDDSRLDPVWEALATGRVPLMIHPMLSKVPPELAGYGIAMSAGIGFPFQTTTALARLLLGGVLERHPDLRLVAAHGGGALPFLIGRLEGTRHPEPGKPGLRESARQLILDAALYDSEAVRLAADLVGVTRLLFGTDHPFPNADVPRIRHAIESGLSASETETVMGTAAAEWYRLKE